MVGSTKTVPTTISGHVTSIVMLEFAGKIISSSDKTGKHDEVVMHLIGRLLFGVKTSIDDDFLRKIS